MYHLYAKKETGFDSKKLLIENRDIDKIYTRIEAETAKNEDFKYIIEETTGQVDSYGELLSDVIEEN